MNRIVHLALKVIPASGNRARNAEQKSLFALAYHFVSIVRAQKEAFSNGQFATENFVFLSRLSR